MRIISSMIMILLIFMMMQLKVNHVIAIAPLTVTSVARDHSSVKIYFQPVAGAKDYRVYDVTNPKNVKYAGLARGSGNTDNPATVIDYNNVGDAQPHTVIVEAVDMLGPVPHSNLYNPDTNKPLMAMGTEMMLGGNKGPTDDGKISTNGQGPYTNNPQPIAQSQPIVIQANRNYKAIPSMSQATQPFFDTFENPEGGTLKQLSRDDANERMTYTLNAGTPLSATLQYQLVDTINSMPFISSDHFMDVLFDGGTPGTNNPLHQGHGVVAYSPLATANFSNGQMIHITQEVDGHMSGRRWMDILLVPANDPAVAFDADTDAFNKTNNVVKLQLLNDGSTLNIFNGPADGKSPPNGIAIWGASGQAQMYAPPLTYSLEALDNKSRYDFFLTQTHAALFVDGKLSVESSIPSSSFAWASQPMKIYFSHYLYHTDNDIDELHKYNCRTMNAYWYNDPIKGTKASDTTCGVAYPAGFGFPRSDERHWDNMGFEVLPKTVVPSNSFSSLSAIVSPPPKESPHVTNTTISPTPDITITVTTSPANPVCPVGSKGITAKKTKGDANCDGITDINDFEIWRREFTGSDKAHFADFNGDGITAIADFELWRQNSLI